MILPGWKVVALVGVAAALWYLLSQAVLPGVDFFWWYYLVPQAWWAGETRLYDDASRGFFLPPWGLWIYLLPALLEVNVASSLVTLASFIIVAWVSYKWSGSYLIGMLAAFCPFSLVLYFTGTPDAWSLLGIYLMWYGTERRRGVTFGAGLMLALIRPQNCLLLIPGLLPAVAAWPRALKWRAGLPIVLVLLGSFATSGFDWPVRWWQNYFHTPPSPNGVTTAYTLLQQGGISLWASGTAGLILAFATLRRWSAEGGPLSGRRAGFERLTAVNAVLAPFLRSPGYVVPLAFGWAGLATRKPRLAAIPYLVSLPTALVPLFSEALGSVWLSMPVWELLFPTTLAIGLLLERVHSQAGNGAGPTPTLRRVESEEGMPASRERAAGVRSGSTEPAGSVLPRAPSEP